MKIFTILLLLSLATITQAQDKSFPFGRVTYSELGMKAYELDTSAVALVLYEFGEGYFENSNNYNLLLDKISLNSSLQISKTVFSSTEYHYLKELFNRIIQVQNADLVFKRK